MIGKRLHIGFRIIDQNPGHTRVSVFIGENLGARGNSGELIIRTDEWEHFIAWHEGLQSGQGDPELEITFDFLPDLLRDQVEA